MKTYLDIEELTVEACHGCRPEERVQKQPFVFRIRLETDFSDAADDLSRTVDYGAAMRLVAAFAEEHSFHLIETLATESAKLLLTEFPALRRVTVRVEKPKAPVPLSFRTVAATAELCRERAYVGLGSNLGDRRAYLDGAVEFLRAQPGIRVSAVSSYCETAPYGGVADRPFLNAAAELETFLSPHALLSVLAEGERRAHRTRETHWGNRTLDLDLLLYGTEIVHTERLIVPHPELKKRAFVLRPLAEIAPQAYVPTERATVAELLARLGGD